MARTKNSSPTSTHRSSRPAFTTEGREGQLISKAINLAEKKLDDGTASDGLVIHYLKLGTVKAELEREKLKHETELVRAKTEAMESAKKSEQIYEEVLAAMKTYSGMGGGRDNDEDEYDY